MVLKINAVNKMFGVAVGEDNRGCILDVCNANLIVLNEQKNLKYQLLADHFRRGDLKLKYVYSEEMMADIFTENLRLQKIKGFMDLFGMN